VTQHHGRRIERILTFLSREHGRTKPDNTVILSVISGSSILAVTKVPGTAMTALVALERLLF
jgi:hypothetical protein